MSTVKELYDEAFLSCIKQGTVTDTDDNYNNPAVIDEIKNRPGDVQRIYQLELQSELNKILLFRDLSVLLGPDCKHPDIRDKAVHLIWSYILYLKIMNAPEAIILGLDNLYTSVNLCNPVSTELNHLLDMKYEDQSPSASPDLATFLKLLSGLRSQG